jgi:hypothetical protein
MPKDRSGYRGEYRVPFSFLFIRYFFLDKKVSKKSSRWKLHLVPFGTKPFGFSESRVALRLFARHRTEQPSVAMGATFYFQLY